MAVTARFDVTTVWFSVAARVAPLGEMSPLAAPAGDAGDRGGEKMNLSHYNKIMILGNNGSGKSWLAKRLAAVTGLPLVHLDAHFWRGNWEMPTHEEWLAKNQEFIAGEKWIIEGNVNHGGTMALRFAAAELAIVLDVNRVTCVLGVIKRLGKPRPETLIWAYEKFNWNFMGFAMAVLTRYGRLKRQYLGLHETYPKTAYWVIKGRRGMRKLLSINDKGVIDKQ